MQLNGVTLKWQTIYFHRIVHTQHIFRARVLQSSKHLFRVAPCVRPIERSFCNNLNIFLSPVVTVHNFVLTLQGSFRGPQSTGRYKVL